MNSSRRPLFLALLGVLLFLGLGVDAARKFTIETSMEHFLPASQEQELYRISRELIDSQLTSRMVLTLGVESDQSQNTRTQVERRRLLLGAAAEFEKNLKQIDGISAVTRGPPAGIEESFFELYFPRRFAYFSLEPENDAVLRFGDAHLKSDAARLKDTLASPEGAFIRNLAPRDPWMLFFDFVMAAGNSALRLDIEQGQFFARSLAPGDSERDFAIFFVELRDSALNSTAQEPLLKGIDDAFAALQKDHGQEIFLEASGANRFAVATERSIKTDIERVFSLSTLGLLLLFFTFFRSPVRFAFLVIPVASGLVFALWLTLTLFGSVHALTLAFGGSLIGVAIDYPIHTLCHHDLMAQGRPGSVTARDIFPSLSLAAGTTILGLLGLSWAAFPGIREIAVFSAAGVSAAFLTTSLSTRLLPPAKTATLASRRAANLLAEGLQRLRRTRTLPLLLVFCAFSVAVLGSFRLSFAPGLESLAPLDPKLLAEDERVQKRLGQALGGNLVISLGSDLEGALQKNEEAARTLARAKDDGILDRFDNVAMLLRSKDLQMRAHKATVTSEHLSTRTLDALSQTGFVPEAFGDLEEELKRPFTPLTKTELAKTPLLSLISPFLLQMENEVAVVSPLGSVRDFAALKQRLDEIPGAHLFSQKTLLNAAYNDLRARTTELLLVGFCFIFAAALVRYKNLRKAAALLMPAVLAAGGTVGILSLLGFPLNLLHLLGLLLICSMGVDYSVFLLDSPKDPSSALLSITLGCLSTMLSFGALGLSSAPALRALGLTIAVGIVLSLILAPTALLLLPQQPEESTG